MYTNETPLGKRQTSFLTCEIIVPQNFAGLPKYFFQLTRQHGFINANRFLVLHTKYPPNIKPRLSNDFNHKVTGTAYQGMACHFIPSLLIVGHVQGCCVLALSPPKRGHCHQTIATTVVIDKAGESSTYSLSSPLSEKCLVFIAWPGKTAKESQQDQ